MTAWFQVTVNYREIRSGMIYDPHSRRFACPNLQNARRQRLHQFILGRPKVQNGKLGPLSPSRCLEDTRTVARKTTRVLDESA